MAYRLLIASASAGAGHSRAAAALKKAFEQSRRDGSAETIDTLRYTSAAFRNLYLRSYFSVIRALPWYWRLLYRRWNRRSADGRLRRALCMLDRMQAGKFIRLVLKERPSHIACTHFLPAEILAWMRRTGRLDVPVGVVVTDYDAHRMWINKGTDHYFVASDPLRRLLVRKGAPADKVTPSGIPIDPLFAEPTDRNAARRELGLDPATPTVLVSGGGEGKGRVRKTVEALARLGEIQVLAVAGRNERLRRKLDELELDGPATLRTFGFVDYIEKLMAASDLLVTKPGGLSCTECLAAGLPMVLTAPIPGQEERNFRFLVRCGAAVSARTPAQVRRTVADLLADRDRLARMSEAARAAARPRAAFDIVQSVLELKP